MVERALRVLGHANSRVGILLRKLFYEKKILPDGEVLLLLLLRMYLFGPFMFKLIKL